jgi:hypothetical protein
MRLIGPDPAGEREQIHKYLEALAADREQNQKGYGLTNIVRQMDYVETHHIEAITDKYPDIVERALGKKIVRKRKVVIEDIGVMGPDLSEPDIQIIDAKTGEVLKGGFKKIGEAVSYSNSQGWLWKFGRTASAVERESDWTPESGGGGEVRTREEASRRDRAMYEWAKKSGETGAKELAQISRRIYKGMPLGKAVEEVLKRRENLFHRVRGGEVSMNIAMELASIRRSLKAVKSNFMIVKPLPLVREGATRDSLENARRILDAGYILRGGTFTFDSSRADWFTKAQFEWSVDGSTVEHEFRGFSFGYSGEGPRGLAEFLKMFRWSPDPNKVSSNQFGMESGTVDLKAFL